MSYPNAPQDPSQDPSQQPSQPPVYQTPPPAYGGMPPVDPYYGGAVATREHPQGTLILVLGILSIVLFQVLGPVAWIMGNKALKDIDANPGAYTNRSNVNIGRICGIVGTVLLILAVVFLVIFFVFIARAATSSVNTG